MRKWWSAETLRDDQRWERGWLMYKCQVSLLFRFTHLKGSVETQIEWAHRMVECHGATVINHSFHRFSSEIKSVKHKCHFEKKGQKNVKDCQDASDCKYNIVNFQSMDVNALRALVDEVAAKKQEYGPIEIGISRSVLFQSGPLARLEMPANPLGESRWCYVVCHTRQIGLGWFSRFFTCIRSAKLPWKMATDKATGKK